MSLVLNMVVFLYEIQNKPMVAITLAEVSIANALEYIDDSDQDQFKEAQIILDMLRSNIDIWTE